MEKEKELYYKLRGIYNSPYYDTEEDIVKSCFILREALKTHSVEYIIAKMKILSSNSNDDYKQKLSTIISSKFFM